MKNTKFDKIVNVLHNMATHTLPVANASLAACIVHKNDIVSIGINQKKTHPFQAQYCKHEDAIFLHAETDAIKNALKVLEVNDLKRASLFVVRVTKDRKMARAKPCEGCMRAIANFGIKNVFYSTRTSMEQL